MSKIANHLTLRTFVIAVLVLLAGSGFAATEAPVLVREAEQISRTAPFRHLVVPGGKTMSVGMTNEIWRASRGASTAGAGTCRFAVTVTVSMLGSSAAIAVPAAAANNRPTVKIRVFIAAPLLVSNGAQGSAEPPLETCGRPEERLSAAKDSPRYLQSLEIRFAVPRRAARAIGRRRPRASCAASTRSSHAPACAASRDRKSAGR